MKKPNILWYLATFTTLQQLYAAAYGFKSTTCNLDSDENVNKVNRSPNTNDTEAQWSATVEKLWYAWRAIAPVSILILQLNLALMPLIGHIQARCVVIVAVLFSTAGVASATLLITFRKNLKSDSKKERWIKATEHPRETCSVDFWTTLSLPLTFLVWSMLLSIASIISLTCGAPGQPSRKSVDVGIVSGVIMTSALLVFVGLYRVVKLVM